MEYLDTYDKDGNYLGKKDRNYVHEHGLWHNTIHCWLYDREGNAFFQIRHEEKTLYTSASGHVLAGESIKEAFGREIKEELGIEIDYNKAKCIEIIPFKMDKVKKDGSIFKDRALANVYMYEFDDDYNKFNFDLNEVDSLVKVNSREALELFERETGSIKGEVIKPENNKIIKEPKEIKFEDFLVNEHETALEKYGLVMTRIIEKTKIT